MCKTSYVNGQSTQFQFCNGVIFAAYAINLGLPPCIWYSVLPVTNLLVSEYKGNLPVLFGMCNTGGFINLHFISPNESCCSIPQ